MPFYKLIPLEQFPLLPEVLVGFPLYAFAHFFMGHKPRDTPQARFKAGYAGGNLQDGGGSGLLLGNHRFTCGLCHGVDGFGVLPGLGQEGGDIFIGSAGQHVFDEGVRLFLHQVYLGVVSGGKARAPHDGFFLFVGELPRVPGHQVIGGFRYIVGDVLGEIENGCFITAFPESEKTSEGILFPPKETVFLVRVSCTLLIRFMLAFTSLVTSLIW